MFHRIAEPASLKHILTYDDLYNGYHLAIQIRDSTTGNPKGEARVCFFGVCGNRWGVAHDLRYSIAAG